MSETEMSSVSVNFGPFKKLKITLMQLIMVLSKEMSQNLICNTKTRIQDFINILILPFHSSGIIQMTVVKLLL